MQKIISLKAASNLSENHKFVRESINKEVNSLFEDIQLNRILNLENKKAFHEFKNDEEPCISELLGNLKAIDSGAKARRLQLKASAGVGKTHAIITNLHKCKGMVVWLLCPNHKLAEEIKNKIDTHCNNIDSYVYKGRNENNCTRHNLVIEAGSKGIDIQKNLCKNEDETCPYFFGCLYQEQLIDFKEKITAKEDKTTVIIMAHNYLVAHCSAPQADLVIVDETH